jgi:hypothetical protein
VLANQSRGNSPMYPSATFDLPSSVAPTRVKFGSFGLSGQIGEWATGSSGCRTSPNLSELRTGDLGFPAWCRTAILAKVSNSYTGVVRPHIVPGGPLPACSCRIEQTLTPVASATPSTLISQCVPTGLADAFL